MYYFDLYTQDVIIFYIYVMQLEKVVRIKKHNNTQKQNTIIMFEMRHMRHAGTKHTEPPTDDGSPHAYGNGNRVLPEALRSRVVSSTMLPQSDEFPKPMSRPTPC